MLQHLNELLADGWSLHLTGRVPTKTPPGSQLPYKVSKDFVRVIACKAKCQPVSGTGRDVYQALVSLLKRMES